MKAKLVILAVFTIALAIGLSVTASILASPAKIAAYNLDKKSYAMETAAARTMAWRAMQKGYKIDSEPSRPAPKNPKAIATPIYAASLLALIAAIVMLTVGLTSRHDPSAHR